MPAPGLDAHMKQTSFAELERRLDGEIEAPMDVITAHLVSGATAATTTTTA
jgi:hypothetical protein